MRDELIFVNLVLRHLGINLDEKHKKRMPIEIPNCGRNDLARLFAELGYQSGAEIGVEEGLYSQVLLEANPALHLYAIDPYRAYPAYKDYESQANLDTLRALATARLTPYQCTRISDFSVKRFCSTIFSADAVKNFAPNSLDFVYIDGNHEFQHVVKDICDWTSRVRPGGIVAGHDFCGRKSSLAMHVVEAVTGYTQAYSVHPWFVLGSKEIVLGEVRDRPRSWFWVKE